jgi:hypothetical protein
MIPVLQEGAWELRSKAPKTRAGFPGSELSSMKSVI